MTWLPSRIMPWSSLIPEPRIPSEAPLMCTSSPTLAETIEAASAQRVSCPLSRVDAT